MRFLSEEGFCYYTTLMLVNNNLRVGRIADFLAYYYNSKHITSLCAFLSASFEFCGEMTSSSTMYSACTKYPNPSSSFPQFKAPS